MGDMLQDDLCQSWRRLRSQPRVALAAAAMLGLAIGLTTAMFTLADALLLRPLPFPQPDRLVRLYMGTDRGGSLAVSPAVWHAWRAQPAFTAVESAEARPALLETPAGVMVRSVAAVSPGLLRMLGARPIRGRLFEAGDGNGVGWTGTEAGGEDADEVSGEDRLLISEDLWRRAFGRDADVIGRTIRLDGRPGVIVGVLPAAFRFPAGDTAVWRAVGFDAAHASPTAAAAAVNRGRAGGDGNGRAPAAGSASQADGGRARAAVPPPQADQGRARAGGPPLQPAGGRTRAVPMTYARLAPMPLADALRIATAAAHAADPSTAARRAIAEPVAGVLLDRGHQRAAGVLFASVGLVFLALCGHVGGLLLVRLSARRRELAVCAALGASRARLLRQALIECGLLGLAGTLAGVGLGWAFVAIARSLLPHAFLLRTLNPLDLDGRALAAAIACAGAATLVAGTWPAWIATRLDPTTALRGSDRTSTDTRATRTIGRGLIVAELALACTLLVGAGLLARSFVSLVTTDRGLDTRGVTGAWIALPSSVPAFAGHAGRAATLDAIEAELRRLPGLEQLALSMGLPPAGGAVHFGAAWRSDRPGAPLLDLTVNGYEASPDFFALYRIPLRRGRPFRPGDSPRDVIVSERLADRLWPRETTAAGAIGTIGAMGGAHAPAIDPIGRSFTFGRESYRVIGVAREITYPSLDAHGDRPELYRPLAAEARGSGQVMISLRCRAGCPEAAVRQRLLAASPALQIVRVQAVDAAYAEALATPRAAAALGAAFAIVASLAAAGGLFSVMSQAVARRRREFGIRAALGASATDLRGLVLRDAFRLTWLGLAGGAAGGLLFAHALTAAPQGVGITAGVTSSDPVTWTMVMALLILTTLLVAWPPAARAARVAPAVLLRDD